MERETKNEKSRSVSISELTANAIITELPENLLIEVVMELTNGFHHPELVRQIIMSWKALKRNKDKAA